MMKEICGNLSGSKRFGEKRKVLALLENMSSDEKLVGVSCLIERKGKENSKMKLPRERERERERSNCLGLLWLLGYLLELEKS